MLVVRWTSFSGFCRFIFSSNVNVMVPLLGTEPFGSIRSSLGGKLSFFPPEGKTGFAQFVRTVMARIDNWSIFLASKVNQ